MKRFTGQEIAAHNTKDDLWVAIHGKVYNLTDFLPNHPGGQKVILKYAGQDATSAFEPIHPPDTIARYLDPKVCLGELITPKTMAKKESKVDEQIRLAREKMPRLDEMYNTFDFESVARTILTPEAWAYYSSGADDEISMRENHNAFHRIWLRPRVMINVKELDLSTTMFGSTVSMPLYISATALGKLGHPEGEVVLTRAAAHKGIIQMIPTLASCSFDDIVDTAKPTQTQWLQLYVNADRSISEQLVRHAEKRGIKCLCVTCDAAQRGRRGKEIRVKYSNEGSDSMNQQLGVGQDEGAEGYISSFIDPSLNWNDLDWVKGITKMPIMLKGIQTPQDAVLAARHGCSGIIISNHGGRQLDSVPSAIEILPDIMEALRIEGLDKNFEVYIDGGIRRGSDIFKAIALGAKGVGIGRPALYAMSTYGDEGVKKLIKLFYDELVMCMRLMGTPSIGHIKREMVDIRNLKDHFVQSPVDYLGDRAYEQMIPRAYISKL